MMLCVGGFPHLAEACRLLERPAGLEEVMWIHVEGSCSSDERRDLAVAGADILRALEQGKNVDLEGVVVTGNVMLDQLPLHPLADLPELPSSVQEVLTPRRIDALRVIPGSIRIIKSQFEKVLATNLSDGALVILGEVDLRGSVFVQSMDWSKTIFSQPVRFSGMRIDFEGFFIGAQFMQSADFSKVVFGTHSRFHKAVFHAPVTFSEVHFNGVAELLEVIFHGEANFSDVFFESGTGFSGSVFQGAANFSGTVFAKEIYFRFSEFQDLVTFAGADFQAVVDFSNAQFIKPADFSGASFSVRPEHAESNVQLPDLSRNLWGHPAMQLVIAVCLLLLVGLHYLRGSKKV